MTPADFLETLQARGVELWRDEKGSLRYRAPKGIVTPAVVAKIKAVKDKLLLLVPASTCGNIATGSPSPESSVIVPNFSEAEEQRGDCDCCAAEQQRAAQIAREEDAMLRQLYRAAKAGLLPAESSAPASVAPSNLNTYVLRLLSKCEAARAELGYPAYVAYKRPGVGKEMDELVALSEWWHRRSSGEAEAAQHTRGCTNRKVEKA